VARALRQALEASPQPVSFEGTLSPGGGREARYRITVRAGLAEGRDRGHSGRGEG
jgi:hypothetical protein